MDGNAEWSEFPRDLLHRFRGHKRDGMVQIIHEHPSHRRLVPDWRPMRRPRDRHDDAGREDLRPDHRHKETTGTINLLRTVGGD
jgi:hypothetical protein